jgi:hypothetical protein
MSSTVAEFRIAKQLSPHGRRAFSAPPTLCREPRAEAYLGDLAVEVNSATVEGSNSTLQRGFCR